MQHHTMDSISLSTGNKLAGRYRVLQKLGEGSFAETFLAEDEHLPDAFRCVIKKLKTAVEDESKLKIAKRLFDEEARTLHQLGCHSNIPQLLAHFEEDNEFYLVEEYVAGASLYQELGTGQQWAESYVTKLLKDILRPLSFVHQKQVIHRDIKPSNIIRREGDGQIVLIDFGAVKQLTNSTFNENSNISAHTVIVGTPGYMPGEQLRGSPRMSSDVYAVGMIGIYALTGLNPALGQLPEDETTAEILWQDKVSISPGLASILEKMVAYDFRQRYPSATEALDALNALDFQQQENAPTLLKESSGPISLPTDSSGVGVQPKDSGSIDFGSGIIFNPQNTNAPNTVTVNPGSGITLNPIPAIQNGVNSGIVVNETGANGSTNGGGVPVGSAGSTVHIPSHQIPSSQIPSSALEPTAVSTAAPSLDPAVHSTSVGTVVVADAKPDQIVRSEPIASEKRRSAVPKLVLLGGAVLLGIGAIAAMASPNIEMVCEALKNCSPNVVQGKVYREASNRAESALSVINSTKVLKDLESAKGQLQQSVDQLKSIPNTVNSYDEAQKLLPNYQTQLKTVGERIAIEKNAQKDLQQAKAIADKVMTQKQLPTSTTALSEDKEKLQKAIRQIDQIPDRSFSATQKASQKQAYSQQLKKIEAEQQRQAALEAEQQRQAAAAAARYRPPANIGGGSDSSGYVAPAPSSPSNPEPLWDDGGSGSGGSSGSWSPEPPPAVSRQPQPAAPAPQEPLWGGGGGSQQAAPPPSNGGGGEPLW